jgi:hypothetical protein
MYKAIVFDVLWLFSAQKMFLAMDDTVNDAVGGILCRVRYIGTATSGRVE